MNTQKKRRKRKRHTEHGWEAAAVAAAAKEKKFSNASGAAKYPCGVFVAHRKLLLWKRIKTTTKAARNIPRFSFSLACHWYFAVCSFLVAAACVQKGEFFFYFIFVLHFKRDESFSNKYVENNF